MSATLSIQAEYPYQALDHEHVTIRCSIVVGFSNAPQIVDGYNVEAPLKANGAYRTDADYRQQIADEVRAFLEPMHGLPANGYDAIIITGAYGFQVIV